MRTCKENCAFGARARRCWIMSAKQMIRVFFASAACVALGLPAGVYGFTWPTSGAATIPAGETVIVTDADYDAIFTKDKPIIFAFHGYHTLIHELTYRRNNKNIHVYGYKEEGTITTPFDMRVQNEVDRFSLVKNVIRYLPQLGNRGSHLIQIMNDKLVEHKQFIHEYGVDLPEVAEWRWRAKGVKKDK